MEVEVNKYHVNKKIKAYIFPEGKMREIGFTDYAKDKWYFCRTVNNKYEISFNVSINKDDPEDLNIEILDEQFLQPYDYQYMLDKDPTFKPCLKVKEQVEKWMSYLQDNGVLSGHIYGEYI